MAAHAGRRAAAAGAGASRTSRISRCATAARCAGSIAHADPSAELPLCLLALQGEVLLASEQGRRRVAAADFFTGMLSTARRNDELLEAVRFPLARPGQGQAFERVCQPPWRLRRVRRRRGGRCPAASASPSAAWPTGPWRATGRASTRARRSALDDALNDFAWDLDARDDPAVSAALRRHLVRRLGRQVITTACQRALQAPRP